PAIARLRHTGRVRGRVPAEPPWRAGDRRAREELVDGPRVEPAARCTGRGVDDRGGEARDVAERREQARMPRDAAAEVAVLVVHEAGDEPAIVELGRDRAVDRRLRVARGRQAERTGDEVGECVLERHPGGALEHRTEDDEAEIAVDRGDAGGTTPL